MEPQDTFWWRLTHLEPAVYKGLVVAIVGLLAALGVAVAPAVPDGVIGVIIAAMALAQSVWTRRGVTPNAKVVAYLPDPNNSSNIMAGEAVTTASDNRILSAAKSAGDAQ